MQAINNKGELQINRIISGKPEMKKIFLLAIFLLLFSVMQAQDKGIHFENNSNWKAILTKAKAQNKYIFVDCYTTWCGPCKYMSTTIFPKEEVGNFFNDKFINVKFQLDTTAKDAEDIKAKYADAAFLQREYKVIAYPTYLFFNPDGEIVHRVLGSSEATEFISKGANALDPQKQYYTQIKKYDEGERDSAFLKNLTLLAIHSLDESGTSKYAKSYFSTQSDLLNNDNMKFVYQTTRSTTDTGFSLMMNDLEKFESVVNKKELFNSLKTIILQAEFSSAKNWDRWDTKQWDIYEKSLRKKYPLFAEDVLFRIQTVFYQNKNNWEGYAKTSEKYASSKSPSPIELNECAWAAFQNCNDKKILEKALLWSKKSFTNQVKIEPGFMDTYANLLYKLGEKNEALKWEIKAQKIAIEQGQDKNWGQNVIDKINKGEKTW